MKALLPRLLGALLACVLLVDAGSIALATGCNDACDGLPDPETGQCIPCGAPLHDGIGPSPVTSDALAILRAAVGHTIGACSGERFCLCDVDCSGTINTSDALRVLRKAVGQLVELECCCGAGGDCLPCTSAELFTRPGSDLDSGWTGIAHNSDVVVGASITVRVKRECSVTTSQECEYDEDCPGSETCEPTCNCNDDVTCEGTGPTHQRKCQNNLADCETNADCPPDIPCVHTFGPPLSLSAGGTPVCVVSVFDGPITGTANSQTGEGEIQAKLRSRVFLGIALDRPCPSCGSPAQNPAVGDSFKCNGGPKNGLDCVVEGVSEDFGGTSSDCPPSLEGSVSGSGLVIRFDHVTTGTTSRTAQLPCKFFGFTGNPLVPGSNPKCIDRIGTADPVCTSNADCRRCTGDIATTCTSNSDCGGEKGFCAEAPDQPVSCGYWCSCGFCNNDPTLPCFQTSDCPNGQVCEAGKGAVNTANMPQQRPNDCSNDNFICGGDIDEQCSTTEKFSCSDQPFRTCESDQDCENFNAGFCNVEARPCFESRITRTGIPSPLGTYCAFENRTCTTNADCTQEGDYCAPDSSRAQAVALFCVPATTSGSVNNAGGITGPGAVRLNGFLQVCRCGDSSVGCDEDCDDGNTVSGDGCDELCQQETAP